MKKRRKKNNAKWIFLCAFSLVVVVLAIVGVTGAMKHSAEEKKQTVEKEDTSDTKEAKEDISEKSETSDATESKDLSDVSDTEEAAGDEQEAFSLEDLDNPDGFDTRPAENGFVLNNSPIDFSALDTTTLDWGQGGDKDEYNRPAGCLQYQEKYGKYNASFIVDDPEKKYIYLTFDEGYEYGCSPAILDTLKEKNVPAVFFVTKPYAEQEPELVQRMIDEGHELGNHSVTHPAAGLPSETTDQQKDEVMVNHQYIKDNFDYDMHLFRYPAGKFSEQSLAILNNCNYKTVFWSFAYLDYDVNNQPDPAQSLQKIMDNLHPGAIYLLHAESQTNTQILGEFIDQARAQGYEFKLFE
ncbi:MAG: polysaccharide deacetylase family protein [Lachnospiraceae bacterium]